MLLRSTDILRLVTGAAGSITFDGYYVDRTDSTGAQTPDRPTSVAAITTATTTTLIGSPASGDKRHVKKAFLTNTHATVPVPVTVQTYDGSAAKEIMGVTLLPGENLIMNMLGEWTHRDVQGALYNYAAPPTPNLGITGCLAETIPRQLCPEVNTTMPASGSLFLQAVYLFAGQLVSNITICSATTAVATPTHYWFALYDNARNLLANSADQTSAAWAANTVKTLAMGTPYRVPTSGLYYIGYAMVATTIPTIKGGTARTGGQLNSAAPIVQGVSTTGITTALPNPAAAITANSTISIYAAVT